MTGTHKSVANPDHDDSRSHDYFGSIDQQSASKDIHNIQTDPRALPDPFVSEVPSLRFQTSTLAPSSPLPQFDAHTTSNPHAAFSHSSRHGGTTSSLQISTDVESTHTSLQRVEQLNSLNLSPPPRPTASLDRKGSSSSLKAVSRTASLKKALAKSLGASSYNTASAASSVAPSPIISALGDLTPLPSPTLSGDSPGPWRRLDGGSTPPKPVRARLSSLGEGSVLVTTSGASIDVAMANAHQYQQQQQQKKGYGSLGSTVPSQVPSSASNLQPAHPRTRSISEYQADPLSVPKRPVVVSGSYQKTETDGVTEPHIRREKNYAESRGLMADIQKPPTPPSSESSRDSIEHQQKSRNVEYFQACGRYDKKIRRWRAVRELGEGTFSRVVLGTSQMYLGGDETRADMASLDRKTLVAVKVCEQGPKGGASQERIEMSLKRELEIMQSIHHPSLVDLKAWNIEPTRAVLVLGYSPGGDLFDVATKYRHVQTPGLMRRIFAELVGALHFLHEKGIVHRDIKLENVLVNLEPSELGNPVTDWVTYPYSVITLTDLGLSRRVIKDEKLETRCGSEDYAAPEVILGQSYDGQATDAWSLGVLLYALLEARLPFDPHPGMSDSHRMRSRTSHRIARVEWLWVKYAGEDGDHEGDVGKFVAKGLEGAMQIAEGLLKRARSRWSMEKVMEHPWVRDAIRVEGGLQWREEAAGEEVH